MKGKDIAGVHSGQLEDPPRPDHQCRLALAVSRALSRQQGHDGGVGFRQQEPRQQRDHPATDRQRLHHQGRSSTVTPRSASSTSRPNRRTCRTTSCAASKHDFTSAPGLRLQPALRQAQPGGARRLRHVLLPDPGAHLQRTALQSADDRHLPLELERFRLYRGRAAERAAALRSRRDHRREFAPMPSASRRRRPASR